MSAQLRFTEMPPMGLLRAALPRKVRWSGSMPAIEAEIPETALRIDPRYASICGLPEGKAVPLAWPQVFAGPLHLAVLTHPDFPLPTMGIVHVRNQIDALEPLYPGDHVRIRCALGESAQVKQGVEFEILTEFYREGRLCWRASTTALSRAVKGKGSSTTSDGEPFPRTSRSASWRVRADMGRRYAAISGDRNPIHLYPITARLFGFPRPIVHGMWTLARALAELHDDLPSGPQRVEVFFRRPVMLPSTVLFTSAPQADGVGFRVATRDGRKVHLWGSAVSLAVPRPEDSVNREGEFASRPHDVPGFNVR